MHPLVKRGRITARKVLLGAGIIGAVAAAVSVVPNAHAENQPRPCVYKDENVDGTQVWDAIDYTKDGSLKCPRLYSSDVQEMSWGPKQITCKDFASMLGHGPTDFDGISDILDASRVMVVLGRGGITSVGVWVNPSCLGDV